MNGSNFGRIPALLIWSNMWKRSSRILAKNIKLILYRHLRQKRGAAMTFFGAALSRMTLRVYNPPFGRFWGARRTLSLYMSSFDDATASLCQILDQIQN